MHPNPDWDGGARSIRKNSQENEPRDREIQMEKQTQNL